LALHQALDLQARTGSAQLPHMVAH
jgi:hypothetical protein